MRHKYRLLRGAIALTVESERQLADMSASYSGNLVSTPSEHSLRLVCNDDSAFPCSHDEPLQTLSVRKDVSQESIKLLIDNVMAARHAEEGWYLLHASAVVRDNRVTVLLGPSFSGKTAVALQLCTRKEHQFVSGNTLYLNYLDGKLCCMGTHQKYIKYKKLSLQQERSAYRQIHTEDAREESGGKYSIPLSEFRYAADMHSGLEVSKVCFVNIRSPVNSHIHSMEKELKYFLAEDLKLRHVGANGVLLNESGDVIGWPPSMDTPAARSLRRRILNSMMSDIGIEYIAGDIGYVTERIVSHA